MSNNKHTNTNRIEKFRQIVGPVAQKIKGRLDNEDPDLGPLAQFLWEFYQRYERMLELQVLNQIEEKDLPSKKHKSLKGGDDNNG